MDTSCLTVILPSMLKNPTKLYFFVSVSFTGISSWSLHFSVLSSSYHPQDSPGGLTNLGHIHILCELSCTSLMLPFVFSCIEVICFSPSVTLGFNNLKLAYKLRDEKIGSKVITSQIYAI